MSEKKTGKIPSRQGTTLKVFSVGDIRKRFSEDWKTLSFSIEDMAVLPPPLKEGLETEVGIKNYIYRLAIVNAVQLAFAIPPEKIFHKLLLWANQTDDKYVADMIALHIRNVEMLLSQERNATGLKAYLSESMTHVVYLAYFEYEMNKIKPILSGRITLPDKVGSSILATLAYSIWKTVYTWSNPDVPPVFYPVLDGAYNETISSGTIDFLIGDTLILFRLRTALPTMTLSFIGSDHIPLIVAFIMLGRSNKYKHFQEKIRYLSYVSPLDGKFTRLAVNTISPSLLASLTDIIYAAPESTEEAETISSDEIDGIARLDRVRLVAAFVLTIDVFRPKQQIRQELERLCGGNVYDSRVGAICRQILAVYSKAGKLFDPTDRYNRQRVVLLHQLYYTLDHVHHTRLVYPRIEDETITDIINKASALYY